jgi:hypothetical protein
MNSRCGGEDRGFLVISKTTGFLCLCLYVSMPDVYMARVVDLML